jgi:tRNA dimethylallyltransferase
VLREHHNLLVILGPTASGKTGLAVGLAREFGGEIISADSRQVYRGMDSGTGKDLAEYSRGGDLVPYHLIDIVDPAEEFSLYKYQTLFYQCFQEITGRGKIPMMVGGTGLYLEAVIRQYRLPEVPENRALRVELAGETIESIRKRLVAVSPQMHNTTDLCQRERVIRAIEIAEFMRMNPEDGAPPLLLLPLVIGIRCEREQLRRRITDRLISRLAEGMIGEVNALHEKGISWERMDSFGLEYRYIARHIEGKISADEMFRILNIRIHQYAKRQETWFRRMEKKGIKIHWIEGADVVRASSLINSLTS